MNSNSVQIFPKWPKVNVLSFDLGPEQLLQVLRTIQRQDYPKELIEWIILCNHQFQLSESLADAINNSGIPTSCYQVSDISSKESIATALNRCCNAHYILNFGPSLLSAMNRISMTVEALLEEVSSKVILLPKDLLVLDLNSTSLSLCDHSQANQTCLDTIGFTRNNHVFEVIASWLLVRCTSPDLTSDLRVSIRYGLIPEYTGISIGSHGQSVRLYEAIERLLCDPSLKNWIKSIIRPLLSNVPKSDPVTPSTQNNFASRSTPPSIDIEFASNTIDSWSQLGISMAYCITINRRKDRQESIYKQCSLLKIGVRFLEATIPSTLPKVISDQPLFNKLEQLSCLVSHLRVLRDISISFRDRDYFLVLEDDVILKPKFNAHDILRNLPSDWEVLQLGTNQIHAVQRNLLLGNHGYIFTPWNHDYWGAFAYLIKPQAADRLCNKYLDCNGNLNVSSWDRPGFLVADFLIFQQCKTYTLCSSIAACNPSLGSNIGYSQESVDSCAVASQLVIQSWSKI